MPLLTSKPYQRPKWLFNGHLETIYPTLFRKVEGINPTRERINTSDGDFLDLDWYRNDSAKLIIISHGLEGNSRRAYMAGMAKEFVRNGFDVLTWNFRGCSEEQNLKPIFYHSGATYDLDVVVNHGEQAYEEIALIGFSLGGNLTLKYLGEIGNKKKQIKRAVAISVPLDLGNSCDKISSGTNLIYSNRFLTTLKSKVIRKAGIFPQEFDLRKLDQIKTLRAFDDLITGPLHGFSDAEEYYRVNSSLQFLEQIEVPALILNAKNDPFLSVSCYPEKLATLLEKVYFEFPNHGGHVGFTSGLKEKTYYSEQRAVEFIAHDT